MDVDPVLPPVKRRSVVAEGIFLFRHQEIRKLLDVFRDKIMLVEQDKRLEKLNQLFQFFEITICLCQRRFLERQGRSDSLNGFYNCALGGRGHAVVAFL